VRLWIAQGFGVGRIPVAPGTFGSVVGLGWFALLLLTGRLWLFAAGTVVGLALSVWLCGGAETVLRQKDPPSVVLDEITALPLCFLVVVIHAWKVGTFPLPQAFFSATFWPVTLAVFALFRLFDILKPWPVRQSQSWPGGWGVTIDDVLAAGYVNLVVLLVLVGNMLLQR
jgi:phosphatidylglycerophosphatase A